MFSKRNLLIAAIIILMACSIVILAISSKYKITSHETGQVLISLVSPFQKLTTQTLNFIKDLWHTYFGLISVARENEELKQELKHRASKASQCEELELANARLRKLLNFQKENTGEFISAEVIGKDPSQWFNSIFIDKGGKDGIKKGMPVVAPEGIVGIITNVSAGYSKSLLIVDPNCAVDGLIQRSRSRGIVKGRGEGRCQFKYVSQKDDVTDGDVVVSSGLDGIFPKGLRVGYISEVVKGKAVFQDIMVTPYVDFARLEEVLVIVKPSVFDGEFGK